MLIHSFTAVNTLRPYIIILLGGLFLLASCSKRPVYSSNPGKGACGNGRQDRGEVGIDCGGTCPNECTNIIYLEGELFRRLSLNPYNQYVVTGPLIIRDKASLEIPAGTTLKVQPGIGAYIAIMQGGSIFAWGTADKPITITSNTTDPNPGDWGGLILCGKAPIDQDDRKLSPLGYYFYGGDQVFDTSGYLKYVKIEYAGAAYDTIQNFNAISFYGTGAYTSVDHIWVESALGAGIQINGGTMTIDDLFISEGENGIEIQEAWQGKGDGWFLDSNNILGVQIKNPPMANQSYLTSNTLTNITIQNPGDAGIHFSGLPAALHIDGLQISNAPLGFGFYDLEEALADLPGSDLLFGNIVLRNNSQLTNQPDFEALFQGTSMETNPQLFPIPDWIVQWPSN